MGRGLGECCARPRSVEGHRRCHIYMSESAAISSPKRIVAYEVTGMSPQSMTLPQKLNGLDFNGTLYPPLNPSFREPLFLQKGKSKPSKRDAMQHTKD